MKLIPMIGIGAVLATSSGLNAGIIHDDFESYQTGEFPGGVWQDVFERVIDNPTPGPTVTIIDTIDAHGDPTKAVQTNHTNGTNGILADIEDHKIQTMSIDVRVDSLAAPGQGWPVGAGFVKDIGLGDINKNPQGLIYGWTNRRWHLFISQGVDRPALNLPMSGPRFEIGAWYTFSITVDTDAGIFNATVADGETGEILNVKNHTVANWDPDRGSYDAITMFDGEVPGSTTEGQSTIDNISYAPTPGGLSALMAMAMIAARRNR